MEIVCGGNEMHVGGNPVQGTKSANGIPNHYGNTSKYKHVSKGKPETAWPNPTTRRIKRAHNALTQALTKGKLFEGS